MILLARVMFLSHTSLLFLESLFSSLSFLSFLFPYLISLSYTPLYRQRIFILSLPLIVGWSDGHCESMCHSCSKFQMWYVSTPTKRSSERFSWHDILVFFKRISCFFMHDFDFLRKASHESIKIVKHSVFLSTVTMLYYATCCV